MSKMSEIAMGLDDQAAELGFESYEEALAKGYDICYGEIGAYLYKPQPEDEQLKAHKAWLEEKDSILEALYEMDTDLMELAETLSPKDYTNWTRTLERARKFIEEAHD